MSRMTVLHKVVVSQMTGALTDWGTVMHIVTVANAVVRVIARFITSQPVLIGIRVTMVRGRRTVPRINVARIIVWISIHVHTAARPVDMNGVVIRGIMGRQRVHPDVRRVMYRSPTLVL